MTTITFTVLGTPTGKGRPRACIRGRHAGVFTDAKTKAAENSFLAQALSYKPATPITGPVEVYIHAHVEIPKSFTKSKRQLAMHGMLKPQAKPDVDNLAKLVLDALNGVFFVDDKQVFHLTVIKGYCKDGQAAGTTVTMRDCSNDELIPQKEMKL